MSTETATSLITYTLIAKRQYCVWPIGYRVLRLHGLKAKTEAMYRGLAITTIFLDSHIFFFMPQQTFGPFPISICLYRQMAARNTALREKAALSHGLSLRTFLLDRYSNAPLTPYLLDNARPENVERFPPCYIRESGKIIEAIKIFLPSIHFAPTRQGS